MKKNQLSLILMLVFATTSVLAQNLAPSLEFRFVNPRISTTEPASFQFDVQVRASQPGSYHRDMQIYFNYNEEAFGPGIEAGQRVEIEKTGIMAGETPTGAPRYEWVNATDNTPSRYYITSQPTHTTTASDDLHNEIPTTWTGYMQVSIQIMEFELPAGIGFMGMLGDVTMMEGGQYYLGEEGQPLAYASPIIFVNDLMEFNLTASVMMLSLDVFPENAGSVSGEGQYAPGQEVTLEATPNEGFVFVNWTQDDQEVSAEPTFVFIMPQENINLVANFEEAVSVPVVDAAPYTFRAFPNPFNQQATIEFSVKQASNLVLELFNLLGERVAVLYDGYAEPGVVQRVSLQAENLQTGIYLFKLTSGEFTYQAKIIRAR